VQLANTHANTLHNHSRMHVNNLLLVLHCATQAEKARLQEVATGLAVTVQHCMQSAAGLEGQATASSALVASLRSRADNLQSRLDYTTSHHTTSHHTEVSPQAACARVYKPSPSVEHSGHRLPWVSVT
jgi:hypothetical protein